MKRDRAALERFYVEAFGLEVFKRDADGTWLAAGTHTRLGLWDPGRKEYGDEGGRHVHFAFSASPGRLDAFAERLRSLAISVIRPERHPGGDRSLYRARP